jgi:hypothetical protein
MAIEGEYGEQMERRQRRWMLHHSTNHPSSSRRRGSITYAVSNLRESVATLDSRLRGNDERFDAAAFVPPQALLLLTHTPRANTATVSQAIDPPTPRRAGQGKDA